MYESSHALLDLAALFVFRFVGEQSRADILNVGGLRRRSWSMGALSWRHGRQELGPCVPLGALHNVVQRDTGDDHDGVDEDGPGRREAHDGGDEHDGRGRT